ncbi:hypothetical protein F0L74_04135 [Chitinophaga agrisoli]|uniref:Uncharacterized protein n=1 Tax=Chitinophaga agrisoli TaxID=2607653 RepID=A0A5B2W4M1_9BACT|nr:hypothetical protein [Chitinophaga agrisoli]KAA2245159.1 hypothetical protein F0L74_04135 [Chitinophaga agrisoli]
MSIAKHIHSLQQHLARLGLQPIPFEDNQQPEVFKVCFLNKYEMAQWRKLQEMAANDGSEPTDNELPSELSSELPSELSAEAGKPR